MMSFWGVVISGITLVVFTYLLLKNSSGVQTVANGAVVNYGKVASAVAAGPGVG